MFDALFSWLRARWVRRSTFFGVIGLLGLAACGQLEQKEREIVFRIEPNNAGWFGGVPDGVTEFDIPLVAEGRAQHIHAWWWPAARRDAPAILYLHGSRWNLTAQLFRIEQLRDFGFSVLAIDYRGFGQSSATLPSEKTVYQDARVAWQRLATLQPVAAKRFIYGHSLGGAVAIDLAAQLSETSRESAPGAGEINSPGEARRSTGTAAHFAGPAAKASAAAGGLIVESSFTSLAELARALSSPWLPVQLLLSQKFDSVDKIAEVRMPVLLVHGTGDRYVPSRFSEALFAAAPEPKKLLLIDGASHNNSIRVGGDKYRQALKELFAMGGQVDKTSSLTNPVASGAAAGLIGVH